MKKVNPNTEVYVDGGIRRGTDVIKAIALGAKCVFVGRPTIWSNAADGEEGLNKMFEFFKNEITLGLKLLGVPDINNLNENCLVKFTIPKPCL